MPMQNDMKTYMDIRDKVIDTIIPANEREDITRVMRSVELSLIASEPGGKMTVSRDGTEIFELYIRYLEQKVFSLMRLELPSEEDKMFLLELIACPKCNGARYVNEQVKKKRVPKTCPRCKGKGTIKKEKECG